MTEETKTFEVEFTSRPPMRITVPADWKVTFGPIIGARGGGTHISNDGVGCALRFWESEKQQRALYQNVVSFRDITIPVEEMAVRVFGKDIWTRPDANTFETASNVERRWVQPDEIVGTTERYYDLISKNDAARKARERGGYDRDEDAPLPVVGKVSPSW